jgi:hypothetical protein
MTQAPSQVGCATCERAIEYCEVCDRADCPTAICYRCLAVVLHQATPQPHDHGG